MWNLRADLPQKPEGNIGSYTEYCAYSFDGNVKVSGKFNKTLEVWHKGSPSPKRIKTDGEINVLVLSGNGQVVMAGGWSKGLHLWNTQTGQFLGELKLECHSSLIRAAALSVDGGTAATVTSFEVLHIWDVFSNACLREIFCDVFAVVLSADGSFILTLPAVPTKLSRSGIPPAVNVYKRSRGTPVISISLPFRPTIDWHFRSVPTVPCGYGI